MAQTAQGIDVIVHTIGKNRAFMNCPQCGTSKIANTSSRGRVDQGAGIAVRCDNCHYRYNAVIDSRMSPRRKTDLTGVCTIDNPDHDKASQLHATSLITIENISRTGIGFKMRNFIKVKCGDILGVRFIFGDKIKSIIDNKAIVRRIDKNFIGAEFYQED